MDDLIKSKCVKIGNFKLKNGEYSKYYFHIICGISTNVSSINDQNYKKPDDIARDYIIVGRALYNSDNIENDIQQYL